MQVAEAEGAERLGRDEPCGDGLDRDHIRQERARLVGQDAFQTRAAAEMDAHARGPGEGPVETDHAGPRLAGDTGGEPVGRHRHRRRIAQGRPEGGLGADLAQGLDGLPTLALAGGRAEDAEQPGLGLRVVAELRQGGHRVTADLLRGVGQQPVEPGDSPGLLLRGAAVGEGHADGADDGRLARALRLGEAVEAGHVLGPERGAGPVAQLPVKLVVRFHATSQGEHRPRAQAVSRGAGVFDLNKRAGRP